MRHYLLNNRHITHRIPKTLTLPKLIIRRQLQRRVIIIRNSTLGRIAQRSLITLRLLLPLLQTLPLSLPETLLRFRLLPRLRRARRQRLPHRAPLRLEAVESDHYFVLVEVVVRDVEQGVVGALFGVLLFDALVLRLVCIQLHYKIIPRLFHLGLRNRHPLGIDDYVLEFRESRYEIIVLLLIILAVLFLPPGWPHRLVLGLLEF